ncbi:MAG: hypothetical protein DLM50_09845 [Candidatus Meridianibacter frigidus]|nr:MAG: hypothetical protein DLM50_09845 [Candidatus Eremiobacteraeota bacterium]
MTFNFKSAANSRANLIELRALQVEQLKRDDEIVRKWIENDITAAGAGAPSTIQSVLARAISSVG